MVLSGSKKRDIRKGWGGEQGKFHFRKLACNSLPLGFCFFKTIFFCGLRLPLRAYPVRLACTANQHRC